MAASVPVPPRFTPLSASAQTAYAQLLDAAHAADFARTVADLPGTFARKQVKGRPYWYYQFLDVAGRKRQVYVVLPADVDVDIHEALQSLQMGLLPIEHSDGGTGATWLDPNDPEFQIDFLTPLHRGGAKPFRHPGLGISLQPLRFMEYLLEDVQQAVVFSGPGVALVNVPHPARFALHKLIVAGERPLSRAVKSNKDVQQAAALLSLLKSQAEDTVLEAHADLARRGPGWSRRLAQGKTQLARVAPELDVPNWLG